MSESAYGFLLDLAHSLTGEIVFFAYFFERHFRLPDAEEGPYHLLLSIVEQFDCSVDFFA